ncbi:MAG: nitrogenase cofactor biosynthesis protein NifB [Eubacteriales bacterium]
MSGCGSCTGRSNSIMFKDMPLELINKTKKHPCYNKDAYDYARMHIPVAPKCNVQCNYCNRKYDCQNESRPGVTSGIMTPKEAFNYYVKMKKEVDKLTVVGVAGPGDALANFEEVKKTVEMIKDYDKETIFCLSTNGLSLPDYMKQIVDLGISHVTITINAIDPFVAARIYKYIYYRGKRYTGFQAGRIIIKNQLDGLRFLSSNNILCKVNIVYIKNENDNHIEDIIRKVKEYGACMTNIMPLIPVENTKFANKPIISPKEILLVRKKSEAHLTQMYHCKQCRADAVGRLDKKCVYKKDIG